MQHSWNKLREVCEACGRSRRDEEDSGPTVCGGKLEYRDILRDGNIPVREIIIPQWREE